MTFRLNVDPQLPAEQQPLIQRLRDLWRQAALVTRELQAPPIMHVRRTGNQAIAAGVPEKIEFDSVRYDTHGYWDATNFRWKPLRTGYYLLQWSLAFSAGASADNSCFATLYNGGSGERAANVINPTTGTQVTACNSAIIFADGSSTYWEVYALASQDCNVLGDQIFSYFCAAYLGDNQLR
jgi:hypothetical protein